MAMMDRNQHLQPDYNAPRKVPPGPTEDDLKRWYEEDRVARRAQLEKQRQGNTPSRGSVDRARAFEQQPKQQAGNEEYARYAAYGNNNPELDGVVPVSYRRQADVPMDPTFAPAYDQYGLMQNDPVPFYNGNENNRYPYRYQPMVGVDNQGYPVQRNSNSYQMPMNDGRYYVAGPYENKNSTIGTPNREQMAMWENEQAKKKYLYDLYVNRLQQPE